MDIKLSPNAQALVDGRAGYPWTRPWLGPIRAWQELFPQGRDNWYFWALPEGQLFGQMFVYDGTNDGNAMMFHGRLVQIVLTLAIGLLIFFWVRQATGNDLAALTGLAFWVFNPNALAHGHLITTDIGATLGITAALFTFARFLKTPTIRNAVICGVATGFALVMKLTAVVLAPAFLVLAVWHWRALRSSEVNFWKLVAGFVAGTWVFLLIIYFPRWSPAPTISDIQARALGVPEWFTTLRPFLIPADLFKSLGLTLGHSKEGHDAYFLGAWSQKGNLFFYPVVYALKSPVALVLASVMAVIVFVRRWRETNILERVAWGGAVIYFGVVLTSNANIGIRHILPVLPLVAVGIGCAVARLARQGRWIATGLVAWQAVVVVVAYPLYLQFFSEAVGGARNGERYFVDSNYDWGQDANRLKEFLQENKINHIYLDYFGTQYNIEYLKIPNTRVNAQQARQIKQGWLVVSASQLMRPEWAWLREVHQPIARVAYTLFVYQLP
ncbi:MAG: glycosyltransferase family 39 protein [Verrucomicrobiota bacterium]